MKKILSLLAISFSLAFAYTAADVYGAWTTDGKLDAFYVISNQVVVEALLFSKSGLDKGEWRLNNAMITFSNSNNYCILISAKIMDCQRDKGKKTYKKAGTIAQYEKEIEKYMKQKSDEADSLKLIKRPFYITLERTKKHLQQIYNEHKNVAKGEFESTADFNKRKAELDKELKDSTVSYFNSALNSIVEIIENDDTFRTFKFDLVKYDADKQIFEVAFEKGQKVEKNYPPYNVWETELKINGKAKVPPEIAKSLRENKEQFSIRHENTDLRNVDYFLIPIKTGIYGENGNEYRLDLDIPKTAKEIVFKGTELWKDNPYAKNLSVSLAEAIQRYAPVKEAKKKAAEAEAARVAAEAEAARIAAEAAELKKQQEKEAIIKNGFTDTRDSKKYKVVKIGSQIWMAENLNYNIIGSKCYDDKPENCQKYGRLYDYETANKVCPMGWHLPNHKEVDILIENTDGKNAGKNLKSKSGWLKNGNGTNAYGFSALPGGACFIGSHFGGEGDNGYWWVYERIVFLMNYQKENIDISGNANIVYDLFSSVRCVKD